jgi:hypothetical protein
MPDESPDCGSPIAYLVLQPGTAVYASGRKQIGTVEHVRFVEEEDVFEGIVIRTGAGLRFVDSDRVERIYERCVLTTLTPEEAEALPAPESGPAVYHADPADGRGTSLGDRFRRLFGKARWSKR